MMAYGMYIPATNGVKTKIFLFSINTISMHLWTGFTNKKYVITKVLRR